MSTLLIATRNAHKVGEIRAILGGDHHYQTLNNHPAAPAIAETANTFVGNATLKVLGLSRWLRETRVQFDGTKLFLLADDSGLEVDALGGAPGVHSARFAALDTGADGNSPDTANNAKLLRLLENIPPEKRTARFRCVLVLLTVDLATGVKELKSFSGACEGHITTGPSGHGGFGYDPLFVPAGHTQSFAELGDAVKNQLSHRAKALAQLKGKL